MSGFGDDLLERCLSQGDAEVLWTGSIGRNTWQIDVSRHRRAECDLRLLSRFLQTLQRHRVFRQVDSLVLPELVNNPLDQTLLIPTHTGFLLGIS